MSQAPPPTALDLFSGIGGMALAVHRVCPELSIWKMCEMDEDCCAVLSRNMGGATIERDVRSLRGHPGANVNVVYGGFPCQDVSSAGKRKGVVDGERSSLFTHMIRLALECRSPYLFLENVAALQHNGLDVVLKTLCDAGYESRVIVLGADHVGARHRRRRLFILARCASVPCSPRLVVAPGAVPCLPQEELYERTEEPVRPRRDWQCKIRMLGNTCVPQQGEYALRCLLGERLELGGTAPGGFVKTWDQAWDASREDWAKDSVGGFLLVIPSRRPLSTMCPTLVAHDYRGGVNARRKPDGTYGSMTLARWIQHNDERGVWGSTGRTRAERTRKVLSTEWAEWLMGFPHGWLA
jgi:site-specific DNA-cytosine methylase